MIPEFIKDPRFATPSARALNATARINKMAEYIGQHTTAEWLERLDAADVPCAPILRRGEIIDNEQVVARGLITELISRWSDRTAAEARGAICSQRGGHRRTSAACRRALPRGVAPSSVMTKARSNA